MATREQGEGGEYVTRHFYLVHQTEHYRNVIETVSVQAPSKWFVHLCSTILPADPPAEYREPSTITQSETRTNMYRLLA